MSKLKPSPGPGLRLAIVVASVSVVVVSLAAPAQRPAIDFKVLKVGEPLTGLWRFANPSDGGPVDVAIGQAPGDKGLVGTIVGSDTPILALTPKPSGIGYKGELRTILNSCGMDRVAITDFVSVGDRVLMQLETHPPLIPCPFLERKETARYYVGPTINPLRLLSAGEITSERAREQIGLGGQPGGPSNPILSGAVSVEGGTELKYLGKVRSLDGSMWIEVQGIVARAVGSEPPRGYVAADALRVVATLTLTRPGNVSPAPTPPVP